MLSSRAGPLLRYGGAVAIVLASAGLADLLFRLTHDARQSMAFLPGVLAAAVLLGAGPGYLVAGAAFLICNFDRVDPRGMVSARAAPEIVTLLGLLAAAALTGALAKRVRNGAALARVRADATEVLLAATREFSGPLDETQIRARLASHLAAAAKGEAFVRHGLRMHVEPADAPVPRELILRVSALSRQGARELDHLEPTDGWTLRILLSDGLPLGFAAWRPFGEALPPEQQSLLGLLADTGAAAIARARLAAAKADAETRAGALVAHLRHQLDDKSAPPRPAVNDAVAGYRLRAE